MLQCEAGPLDQSGEHVLFDHTLDNMSMMDGGEGAVSELLRGEKLARSRFVSDDSFFAGNNVPDKQSDDDR